MKPNQLHPTTHVQAQCRPYLFLLFALLCVLPLWADQPEDIKKLSAKVEAATTVKAEPKAEGKLAKMKAFVRKAVDCCIE